LKFAHFLCKPGMNPHQRYEQLWRDLQACDELDFDYGFCVEHHFRRKLGFIAEASTWSAPPHARRSLLDRVHDAQGLIGANCPLWTSPVPR
jgi:hypothetical protein